MAEQPTTKDERERLKLNVESGITPIVSYQTALRLIAQVDALAKALGDLFQLVENGVLVRDITRGHEAQWAMRQAALVLKLVAAQTALAALDAPVGEKE